MSREQWVEAMRRFWTGWRQTAARLPWVLRGRRGIRLGVALGLSGILVAAAWVRPLCLIAPGEVGVRANLLNGRVTSLGEGWAWDVPHLHRLQRFTLLDQSYRTSSGLRADGAAPFQSVEGLSIGVDVTVRYALDAAAVPGLARGYGTRVDEELVSPLIDGTLRRTFARHTVREIFATQRGDIQRALEKELGDLLIAQGIQVRSVLLGNVDLPAQYRAGVEALIAEEMSAEKMRFTLELKEKQVRQTELEAEAEKVRQEKAAEAAASQELIAARGREEAMKHILPFKQKEIEEKRLEAEATKAARVATAEGEAEARRIEAGGEADARRKLAESDAYRLEVTGKAQSEQLARDSELISRNPLLIQKTLADKLSDKIQVIIAPPQAGGFFAGGLVGAPSRAAGTGEAATKVADPVAEGP
jgi:regulator of protease activity HflC (stomatin/prohibitin superfamily)